MTVAQEQPHSAAKPVDTSPARPYSIRRVRMGLGVTLLGFLLFLMGARPALFGLDRSPVIGFIQISVFLIGLAFICIGGYISIMALWKNRIPSIAADFGLRFVCTGYVIAFFAGMADMLGIGSHPLPGIPYFGELQSFGVLAGEAIIGIGLMLIVPYTTPKE
jgi:hypothetical protein